MQGADLLCFRVKLTPVPLSRPPPGPPATQTIKDVLQSLVDDGLVDTDKVGTSNYFWAFPSKGSQAVRETDFTITETAIEKEEAEEENPEKDG